MKAYILGELEGYCNHEGCPNLKAYEPFFSNSPMSQKEEFIVTLNKEGQLYNLTNLVVRLDKRN